MIEQPDGSWNVWCRRHGRRYTTTAVRSKEEARSWWREHTGRATNETWCPQPTDVTPDPLEFPS